MDDAPPLQFDHVGLHVRDLDASRAFYTAALAPLGIVCLQDHGWLVFGNPGGVPAAPFFVVASDPERTPDRIHVAFRATSEAAVDAFHAAGLAAGGTDHGAPGPRPVRPPGRYYAAYLLDPDGNNVEAGVRSA